MILLRVFGVTQFFLLKLMSFLARYLTQNMFLKDDSLCSSLKFYRPHKKQAVGPILNPQVPNLMSFPQASPQ
jgi:hypothetical protein